MAYILNEIHHSELHTCQFYEQSPQVGSSNFLLSILVYREPIDVVYFEAGSSLFIHTKIPLARQPTMHMSRRTYGHRFDIMPTLVSLTKMPFGIRLLEFIMKTRLSG